MFKGVLHDFYKAVPEVLLARVTPGLGILVTSKTPCRAASPLVWPPWPHSAPTTASGPTPGRWESSLGRV